MWVLLRATVHAGWEPPMRRMAWFGFAHHGRKLLSTQPLQEKWVMRAFAHVRDKVRHGAAVQPCRLHVVWRKA